MHHGVRITDSAAISAATLSHRYISDRFLPDKAIDLVDEAASRLRTEIDSKPAELDTVDREVMQLQIEREALKKEKDAGSKERLEKIEEQLANLEERSTQLSVRWQAETDAIEKVRGIREQIDQVNQQIEEAERQTDLQRAAELRYGHLRQLENDLANAESALVQLQGDGALLKEEVDSEDIAAIISKWTGIPASKLLEGEIEKLVQMEKRLHNRIVGQDGPVEAVSRAVRRSRSGLQDPNRPIGFVHLFGTDGCGENRTRPCVGGIPVR